jgi:4-aminobutyrate aminotransferase-like enzyme
LSQQQHSLSSSQRIRDTRRCHRIDTHRDRGKNKETIEEQKVFFNIIIIIIMTNSQSKPVAAKIAERIQAQVKYRPPPIGFTKSAKAAAKKESSDYREF